MTRIARAWTYFVAARLLLVGHFNHVTRERALLVYTIIKGLKFDIGQFICDNILHITKGSTTAGLAYPTIITTLCLNAGIAQSSNEIEAPILKSITGQVINSYEDEEGEAEHEHPVDNQDLEDEAGDEMDV